MTPKRWPLWLFRCTEALTLATTAAAAGLAAWAFTGWATTLPVPSWAWALLTAAPAATVTALWRDVGRWLTTWLNWRTWAMDQLQERWGLPDPGQLDTKESST